MSESQWWTAPTENEDATRTIMVTGRKDVDRFRSNPRYSIRIEISWRYESRPDGMPSDADAEMMERVLTILGETFEKDPVAVLTGIFTGDGERDMVFYTTSTHIFGRKLNEALASLPLLPLTIRAENDPRWEAYDEMASVEINLD